MKKVLMTQMMTSISEVMETMFYMPVEIAGENLFSNSGLDRNNSFACRLDFNGDTEGSIILAASKKIVIDMAQNLLGEEKEQLTQDHFTGSLTEMLNMVCGHALSKIPVKKPFELGIPMMIESDLLDDDAMFNIVKTTESRMAIQLTIKG